MERILKYINNYFAKTKEKGEFVINDNKIKMNGKYITGQYVLITGSIFNDGLHKIKSVEDGTITLEQAENEEFKGTIYGLIIPKMILDLEQELRQLEKKYVSSIYNSESFGNYSYSLATNKEGQLMTAFDVIAEKLRPYRQIYETSLERAKEVK